MIYFVFPLYSTIPGFCSWRNASTGSWFIQSLCKILEQHGFEYDLISNLTRVARKVAYNYESDIPGNLEKHQNKQMPCVRTSNGKVSTNLCQTVGMYTVAAHHSFLASFYSLFKKRRKRLWICPHQNIA